MKKSPFTLLADIHDHIWRSDWPLEIRRAACQLVWNTAIQSDLTIDSVASTDGK